MADIPTIQHFDRKLKDLLRQVDVENLPKDDRQYVQKIKQAVNEVRLDIRDYDYAQSRTEQLKWAKIAKHNLLVIERYLFLLDDVFGPADMADLGASMDVLRERLV